MKKSRTLLIISSLILPICGCSNSQHTSFQEYIEIVNNAKDGDKNVFVFTSSKCAHCQKIMPLLDKYNQENNDVNIYTLSVDHYSFGRNNQFKDKTMGYLSGQSIDDCIKRLDNRIALYVASQNIIPSPDGLIAISSSQRYAYTVTPLMLFYLGGIEVKIINNVNKNLEKNEKGNIVYDSFEQLMSYPSENPSWNKEFDLTYYQK